MHESFGHPIEKVDHARLQTVLGANDQQPVIRNETLQHGGAVPQMVAGGPDVGADGVRDKGLGVLREGCGQQGLDGGPDPVDDGAEVGRLMGRGWRSSSNVAAIAPHCVCPSTTASLVPKRPAANSTLPT